MVLDSHVHFWKYEKSKLPWISKHMKSLQKDHLPQHIEGTLRRNGVDYCIAIQAEQSQVETRFLAELATTHSIIRGVVGWVDLQANNVEDQLYEFSMEYPIVRGFRHNLQNEPDEFLTGPNFRRGIAALQPFDYTYDILINSHQLLATAKFISAFPEQKFVIDHCGLPKVKARELDNWKIGIQKLASHPNVYCKLSGLFTEADWKEWKPGEFYPYLDVVFEYFGVNRLMFGSDWPVLLLAGSYVQWKSLLEKYLENYPEEEKGDVFGNNAVRFYGV